MSILKELKEMIAARGGNAGSANTVSEAVDVLTDLGGGSGGSNFIVTVTVSGYDGPEESAIGVSDKSLSEITDAWNSFKTIWVHVLLSEEEEYYTPIGGVSNSSLTTLLTFSSYQSSPTEYTHISGREEIYFTSPTLNNDVLIFRHQW